MNVSSLLKVLNIVLTDDDRRAFRQEKLNCVPFAGLPTVKRYFLEV